MRKNITPKVDLSWMADMAANAQIDERAAAVSLQLDKDIEAARKEWRRPVIVVTPDMLGVEGVGGKHHVKAVPGILVDQCKGVEIKVLQPTLFHPAMLGDKAA